MKHVLVCLCVYVYQLWMKLDGPRNSIAFSTLSILLLFGVLCERTSLYRYGWQSRAKSEDIVIFPPLWLFATPAVACIHVFVYIFFSLHLSLVACASADTEEETNLVIFEHISNFYCYIIFINNTWIFHDIRRIVVRYNHQTQYNVAPFEIELYFGFYAIDADETSSQLNCSRRTESTFDVVVGFLFLFGLISFCVCVLFCWFLFEERSEEIRPKISNNDRFCCCDFFLLLLLPLMMSLWCVYAYKRSCEQSGGAKCAHQ